MYEIRYLHYRKHPVRILHGIYGDSDSELAAIARRLNEAYGRLGRPYWVGSFKGDK